MKNAKSQLIESLLVCPQCHHSLEFTENESSCSQCEKRYPIRDGKYFFIANAFENSSSESFLDGLKSRYKKYPKVYDFLVKVISPVHFRMSLIRDFIKSNDIVVNVGSGNQVLESHVINCDVFPYDNVDVVVDASALPFKTESVDGVVNIAVLEHVSDPWGIVEEMRRILKTKGSVFSVIPFMQPYHASPMDFHRFTKTGICHLHKSFHKEDCAVFSGPVSGFLWTALEFFSTILSFGSRLIHDVLFMFFMLISFPFKYLDLIAIHFPAAELLASSFYFHGRKVPVSSINLTQSETTQSYESQKKS